MLFHRPDRVSSVIHHELGNILLREVELPGVIATITEVAVSKKMETARVRISFLPSEKAPEAFKQLNRMRGRLQFLLARTLNIKPMPQIMFEIDRGPENAAKIEKVLLEEEQNRHRSSDAL